MKTKGHHKHITEHVWRSLRASLLFIAATLWLAQDGYQGMDVVILILLNLAHLVEQFHGYICNLIERVIGWKKDFSNWG